MKFPCVALVSAEIEAESKQQAQEAFLDAPIGRFVSELPISLGRFERIVEFRIRDCYEGSFGTTYKGYVTTDEKQRYDFEVSDEQIVAILGAVDFKNTERK